MEEYYTANDIAVFLVRKGYIWYGVVLDEHRNLHKITTKELHTRTNPVVLLVLYKDNKQYLQYVNVKDLTFKMLYLTYQSQVEPKLSEAGVKYSKFVLDEDYSQEWADFLAIRHNATL